jgi:hypothetical protein
LPGPLPGKKFRGFQSPQRAHNFDLPVKTTAELNSWRSSFSNRQIKRLAGSTGNEMEECASRLDDIMAPFPLADTLQAQQLKAMEQKIGNEGLETKSQSSLFFSRKKGVYRDIRSFRISWQVLFL